VLFKERKKERERERNRERERRSFSDKRVVDINQKASFVVDYVT